MIGVANQVTLALANQVYVQAASSKAQAEVRCCSKEYSSTMPLAS